MFKSKIFNKADKAAKQQPVFKQDYFNSCHRTYSCIHCRAHLANHDELISKLFQGNHGRAYLFNKVVNIGCKQAVQRELLTGLHAVADIYCDSCETTLGWKYEQAFVPSQKYKEGKYIIELVHMLKENNWDPTSYNARELLEDTSKDSHLDLINYGRSGYLNDVTSSNYCCNNEFDSHHHRDIQFVSIEAEKQNRTNSIELMDSSQEASIKVTQRTQPSINNHQDANSENIAPIEIVEIKSDDIELIEQSIDKLQLTRQENKHDNININNNDNNDDSRISPIPLVSPNNSLCSSQSQSDLSSSSSQSVKNSCNSTDNVASKSSPDSSKVILKIKVVHQSNTSDNNTGNQFVEKPTVHHKGESTITGINTSSV